MTCSVRKWHVFQRDSCSCLKITGFSLQMIRFYVSILKGYVSVRKLYVSFRNDKIRFGHDMFLFGHDVFLFDISMFRFGNDKFLLGSNMFRLRHDVFPLVYYLFISSIAASGAMFFPFYEFKPQIIPRELFWFETTRFCLGPFLKAMPPEKKAKKKQSKDMAISSAEIDRSSNAVLAQEWKWWRASNPVRSIAPKVLEHFPFCKA